MQKLKSHSRAVHLTYAFEQDPGGTDTLLQMPTVCEWVGIAFASSLENLQMPRVDMTSEG